MTRPAIRRLFLAVAVLVLLGLSWTGLSGGVAQWSESRTPGQIAQTISQFGFGLFALLSLVATRWAPRWSRVALAGWIVSATLAAGLASVVWGGTSLLVGLMSAGGGFLIAFVVAWLLVVGARSVNEAVADRTSIWKGANEVP